MLSWPISDQARSAVQYARAAPHPRPKGWEAPPVAFSPQAGTPHPQAVADQIGRKETRAVKDHSTTPDIGLWQTRGRPLRLYTGPTPTDYAAATVVPLWAAYDRRRRQDATDALGDMAETLDRMALALPDPETVADLQAAARRLRKLSMRAGAR